MTAPRAGPIFHSSCTNSQAAHAALATLTIVAGAVVFSDARCLCGRKIMAIPGIVTIEVRAVASNDRASGRGRVVSCGRCRTLCEVIEHGPRAG